MGANSREVTRSLTKKLAVLPKGVVFGTTSLSLPPGCTVEQWNRAAEQATHIGHGFLWWLGDLVAYAERNFEREDDEAAVEGLARSLGLSLIYLRNLGRTARAYAVRDRIKGLGVSHHLICVNVPHARRQKLLRLALKRSWPARILKEKVVNKADRTVALVMRLLASDARNREFIRDVKWLAEKWEAKSWYIWGKKLHRRGGISRGTPMLAEEKVA